MSRFNDSQTVHQMHLTPNLSRSKSLAVFLCLVTSNTMWAQSTKLLDDSGVQYKQNDAGAVVEINFTDVTATDALAMEVGACSELVKLTINQSEMSPAGWEQLSRLKKLQQFDLRGCKVSNKQLTLAVAGMPKLRALRLSGKSGATVDDDGMIVLAKCPELKALAIDHLWISVDGVKHLAGNRRLAELYAAGSLMDDEALTLLAQFPGLKKLRLAQTTVTGNGIARLSDLPIEDLDLSECSQLDDAALQQVARLDGLKRLNLWRDTVGDAGLAKLSRLTQLQWLNLDNTQVTDAGLESLSEMQELTFLHLGSTSVSDAGMTALESLSSLKDLRVTRTAVTQAGVDQIQAALEGLKVQLKYIEGK